MNPVHKLKFYFHNVLFNIFFTAVPRFFAVHSFQGLSDQDFVDISCFKSCMFRTQTKCTQRHVAQDARTYHCQHRIDKRKHTTNMLQNNFPYPYTIMSQIIRMVYALQLHQCNNFSPNCCLKVNNILFVSVHLIQG